MENVLSLALGYTQWRNFQKVIESAMIACENSGHTIEHDFAEVSKIAWRSEKYHFAFWCSNSFAEVEKSCEI